jgi:hypothetical protein
MPDPLMIAKAELYELDADFKNQINKNRATKVQFNPDTLKVVYANQIEKPSGGGNQEGAQSEQFVGAGSTKLTATLWFDVTQDLGGLGATNDVRELTQRVAYFITPREQNPKDKKQFIPPAVRFVWGTFQFDGVMEGMEETLELFSAEGRPLRASVNITITQQKITTFAFNKANDPPKFTRRFGGAAGTSPQTPAPAGSNLQSMNAADRSSGGGGGSRDWQSVATANGIENPRRLEPGQLIDFNRTTPQIDLG